MGREVKDMVIADIQSRIGDVKDFIVVDCSKVDAITANRWRLALRKQQMSALTVKNSVASTLVWGGDDIVALSRSVAKWAKEIKNFEIKGGTVEGESLDAAAVDALSKSAGRLETIGEIAGLMLALGRQLAGCLQGPGGRLAGQLKTLSEEKQA